MIETIDIVRANWLGKPRGRPKQFAAGRICTEDDCSTILSSYNENGTCWLHTPTKVPRLRGEYVKKTS